MDVWQVPGQPVTTPSRCPVRARRTVFIVLPAGAAVATVALLGPDLSDCVVGYAERWGLLFRAVLLIGVTLCVNYCLMFLVRWLARTRGFRQAAQVMLLLLALALGAGAYELLVPAPDIVCKNSPEYGGSG